MMFSVGKRLSSSICLILFVLVGFVISAFAQSEIILENGFEKGVEKWESRGERVFIKSEKDQVASGAKSLKISGRSAFWQGAQLNITKLLSAGRTYKFSLSVKLAKGEPADDVKMTMQRGDNQFDGVGIANANPNEWTTISGKFKPSGGDLYLLLYVEAGRANTSFYIDDFKIELAGDETPPQKGTIVLNDFEDLTAQNWIVRGEGVQMFSTNAAGSQSLKVTGRTAVWHGLALDISPLFFKGRTYLISVSVKLVKGQPGDSLKISMQQTPPKGEATYTPITTAATVTDGEWVTLSGEYKVTTTDNNLLLYVEAAGATTSFYIDNFLVKLA